VEELWLLAYRQTRVATTLRWLRWLEGRDGIAGRPRLAVSASMLAGVTGRPAEAERWAETARFQETLRKLAMIDEALVEDQAGLRLSQARELTLEPKTAALLRLGASVAIGSPSVCIEWSTGQAMAAGATDDEIADVLLAIAPVAGLGRVVCAAPTWRPRWGTTSRPRWTTRTINEGWTPPRSAARVSIHPNRLTTVPRSERMLSMRARHTGCGQARANVLVGPLCGIVPRG
jgi:alkylhydroperoxidase/carboxymuconolactone decarboxylase family protein YurZ